MRRPLAPDSFYVLLFSVAAIADDDLSPRPTTREHEEGSAKRFPPTSGNNLYSTGYGYDYDYHGSCYD
ncbi:hypothetical protein EST38_g4256 [Candolleomyces aberdarensis]|uniref:Uncharacterized protein n=1 Tax=Candolleomyces aberdarensis TaxID=2316362 RepID=A0A4Q2DN32_9AGAR|nr:hypothetical protein EST38_g4256 [Candolleomyces aberdarensis]